MEDEISPHLNPSRLAPVVPYGPQELETILSSMQISCLPACLATVEDDIPTFHLASRDMPTKGLMDLFSWMPLQLYSLPLHFSSIPVPYPSMPLQLFLMPLQLIDATSIVLYSRTILLNTTSIILLLNYHGCHFLLAYFRCSGE